MNPRYEKIKSSDISYGEDLVFMRQTNKLLRSYPTFTSKPALRPKRRDPNITKQ